MNINPLSIFKKAQKEANVLKTAVKEIRPQAESLKFFPRSQKASEEQMEVMRFAQNQFSKAHPEEFEEFVHGVGADGTIGGIAKAKKGSQYKALSYCTKADGTQITTYYYPTRRAYLCGDVRGDYTYKMKRSPKDISSATKTEKMYFASKTPTTIDKHFYNLETGKENGRILIENKSDGTRIRKTTYPSGNVYKKVTNAQGDVLEHTKL